MLKNTARNDLEMSWQNWTENGENVLCNVWNELWFSNNKTCHHNILTESEHTKFGNFILKYALWALLKIYIKESFEIAYDIQIHFIACC